VSKSSVEASTCTIGGREENIIVDSKGGGEFGGGVGSLLVDASTNLALRLIPSKKIYKTPKNTLRILYMKKEFKIAQVVEGKTLPSSPS
jgi:hypothetical protein